MERQGKGILIGGARLVCSRWRALACAYSANLLLSFAAAASAASSVSGILNHSFESGRLVKGFDLTVFISLMAHPEVSLGGAARVSVFFSLFYFVFMLFLTGGMLRDFREDRELSSGEFFEACGVFFWRFVRLSVVLLILLIPFAILFGFVVNRADTLSDDAPNELTGFRFLVGGTAAVYLLLVAIRLWFDVAQVRAVAEGEPKIRRALGKSFRQTFGNFLPLFGIYLATSFIAWVGWAAAAWLWVKHTRPEQIGQSFLLGQFAVLLWIVTRLWLRACETVWYHRKFPAPVVFAEAPAPPAPADFESVPSPAPPLTTPPDDTSS